MKSKITGRGGPGRGQGRKPLADGEAMVLFGLRVKPAQLEKLKRLGGAAWIRERINRAKDPDDR